MCVRGSVCSVRVCMCVRGSVCSMRVHVHVCEGECMHCDSDSESVHVRGNVCSMRACV